MKLLFKLLARSSGSVVTGGIISATIADATAIDPQSSIGASGSGWVAHVLLKGITSLVGTVVPSDLIITVSDPGYSTTGEVTSVTRIITGVAHLRRQYPNGNNKIISTDGVNVLVSVTLDDWIYSNTTITSVSIGNSFYPSCVASTAPTKNNLSTQAYPKALFSWINPQQNTQTGSTYAVEAVAFHRHARNQQQVACIKYSANDGTTDGAELLVGTTTLSTIITQGNIPEVWAGSVDMSAMTQATLCNINAKVYPWIGDSTAVLNLTTDETPWPTVLPTTRLRVVCDRTGGYGGGYAYVKVGASGGAVSGVPATALASPFPTVTAALAALKTWNNANKGHNDIGGGIVRLMDATGSPVTHSLSTSTNSPGTGICVIEKDPASVVTVSVTNSASLQQMPDRLLWKNLTLVRAAVTYNFSGYNNVGGMAAYNNCIFDATLVGSFFTYFDYLSLYNITMVGTTGSIYVTNTNAGAGVPVCAGFVAPGIDQMGFNPLVLVGSNVLKTATQQAGGTAGCDGTIFYNNTFRGDFSISFNTGATGVVLTRGVAMVQNVVETTATRSGLCMNMWADGDATTITNYIDVHNTAVGARCSRMYNDVAATKVIPNGMLKLGTSKYNIWDDYNIKSDTFAALTGSVGNWAYMYSVGNVGNISLFGAVQALPTDAPHNDNNDTPYMGNIWLPSSEYNLGRTALGFTVPQITAMFTSFTVTPAVGNVKGGNYKPLVGSSLIRNRVPSGHAVLKRDIEGTLRANDGTGAAGAYEA